MFHVCIRYCRATAATFLFFLLLPTATWAEITAPGTDYPTFWSGELRIVAQRSNTRVTLLDLNLNTTIGLPGNITPDIRVSGGPCYIESATGNRTEAPSNPFVLPDRGAIFRCTGGLGGPQDEIQVRILTESADGQGEIKPVTVWTGSVVEETLDNSWGSFLPADFGEDSFFGRELGSRFIGFTQSELIAIMQRTPGNTASITIRNFDAGTINTFTLDGGLLSCPDMTAAFPPIPTDVTPCFLHDGPEIQAVYIAGFSDDRIDVTTTTQASLLVGHRLFAHVIDDSTITHENADWSATPPSWSPGDEGIELGTLFYTFARQALTIFPIEHDTQVEIIDLSDGDDSRSIVLEHGDLLNPKQAGVPRLSIYTPIREARVGDDITPRLSAPQVELIDNNENPFDNDLVKIVSDKPILVYQGPVGSDVNEFADVAYTVPIGVGERLGYVYAQNFGQSNDLQLFSMTGDNVIDIRSLSYTEGFSTRKSPIPTNHDFNIEFFEGEPAQVVASPVHDTFVVNGIPGQIQHFGSGTWNGEMLVFRSKRPITIINGDYDRPHFGAFVPFIPTSKELPPVAVLDASETSVCFGGSISFSGSRSFDQDPDGTPPDIQSYAWDLGDGTSVSNGSAEITHVFARPGTYTVTLTVTDNEGDEDSDVVAITVNDPASAGCEACGDCEGKVSELSLRYIGVEESVHVSIIQKKDGIVVFNGPVYAGVTFDIQGVDKHGTLGTEIIIKVNGQFHTRLHTSCSQPIGAGMIVGDFFVASGRSRVGGLFCPIDVPSPGGDDPTCGCEGKVTDLALRFLGDVPASVEVVGKRGRSRDVLFQGYATPGAVFTVHGLPSERRGFDGTLGTDIFLMENGTPSARFHTSCSQPIGPGHISGNFEVVAGTSLKGGPLCTEACADDDDSSSDDSKSGDSKSSYSYRGGKDACGPGEDDGSSDDSKSSDSKSSDSKSSDSKSSDSKSKVSSKRWKNTRNTRTSMHRRKTRK